MTEENQKPTFQKDLKAVVDCIYNGRINDHNRYQRAYKMLDALCEELFPENKEYSCGMLWFSINNPALSTGKKRDCSLCVVCVMERLIKEYMPRHYTVHKDLSMSISFLTRLPFYTIPSVKRDPKKRNVLRVLVPCLGYICHEFPMDEKIRKHKTANKFTWLDLADMLLLSLGGMPKQYVGEHTPMLRRLLSADNVAFSRYPMWMPHGPWKELMDTTDENLKLIDSVSGTMTVYAVLFSFDGEWVAPVYGLRRCGGCGKEEQAVRDKGVRLLVCTGCERSYYCSRGCQKAAWKEHKPMCQKWKN